MYYCDICDARHDTFAGATDCEVSHREPFRLVTYRHELNKPHATSIVVEYVDGTFVLYESKKVVDEEFIDYHFARLP